MGCTAYSLEDSGPDTAQSRLTGVASPERLPELQNAYHTMQTTPGRRSCECTPRKASDTLVCVIGVAFSPTLMARLASSNIVELRRVEGPSGSKAYVYRKQRLYPAREMHTKERKPLEVIRYRRASQLAMHR